MWVWISSKESQDLTRVSLPFSTTVRGPPESPWQESFPGAEAQSIAYFRNDNDTENNSNYNFDYNHDIYDNDDDKKGNNNNKDNNW